jgi:ketosteroid isomerase-like protein
MDAEAAARAWVEAWRRAWPAKDPGPLAAVYADEVVFRSQPFRELHLGREGVLDYASWAFADQEEFGGCWFGTPAVSGDRATVEYWAILVEQGREVTIAGVALLRFDDDGRVRAQRDYWSLEQGAREPPEGWGTW